MADTKISSMATHSSIVAGDYFVVVDSVGGDTNTALFSEVESSLNHDSLAGYVANEHLLPAAIDHDALLNFAANEHFTEASIDHGNLVAASLTDDDHVGYALLAGRAGGQTLIGGTAASNNLILNSTSNATKGGFYLSDAYTLTSSGINCSIFGSTTATMNPGTGGDHNTIIGGLSNSITRTAGTSLRSGICGSNATITALSGSSYYNWIFGGSGGSIALSSDNYGTIVGGLNNTLNGVSNSIILGGEENTASHSYVTMFGRGGNSTAQYDLIWSNYDVAANDSTANAAFRLDGATADAHVGRHVDNATAGSNTNKLHLHTTNASNQSNSVALTANTGMTTSYEIFMPATAGSAGDALVVSAVSGTHIQMGWAAN